MLLKKILQIWRLKAHFRCILRLIVTLYIQSNCMFIMDVICMYDVLVFGGETLGRGGFPPPLYETLCGQPLIDLCQPDHRSTHSSYRIVLEQGKDEIQEDEGSE